MFRTMSCENSNDGVRVRDLRASVGRVHHLARLTSLWSWLPAFRAVAETESVTEAARRLRVTPSALSRSVKLLEDNVGVRLFERVGRHVKLTREGQTMLLAVRDAMRVVDDGLVVVAGERFEGVSGIVCEGDYPASCLSRALAQLHREHGIVGHIDTHWCSDVPAMLSRGDLDVAFVSDPPRSSGLHVEHVATIEHAVYCGPSHPLFGRREVSTSETLEHSFVALSVDATEARNAGRSPWPRELERRIAVYVPTIAEVIDACVRDTLLAALPVASADASTARLFRLSAPELPSPPLFALTRRALTPTCTRASVIVAAMRAQIDAPRRPPPVAERAAVG
jgi:DNA-binding transcriptional LysR family regulator